MFKSEGRLEGFIVSSWFIVEIMKLVEYRIAIKIIVEDGCIIIIYEVIMCDST